MLGRLGEGEHAAAFSPAARNLPSLRVGFTASRKVGNAVKRNRARRLLRVLVQEICPSFAFTHEDMVIIARPATLTASFSYLLKDFRQALRHLELSPL